MMWILLLCLCHGLVVQAWDQFDLEMFDLMEEINTNFYDFMNVSNAASSNEIKRSYHKLSLKLHPDRNINDPDAHARFRQLSVIYQILKDTERRNRYDEALENGIPDWKTPVFYYRKLRKMSNIEIAFLISVMSITIHFATLLGFAFEKRWTLQERLQIQLKRHKASEKKKRAIDLEIAEKLQVIKWPTFKDILIIALLRGIFNFIVGIPAAFGLFVNAVANSVDKVKKEREEQEELNKEQKERIQRKEQQKKKRNEHTDKQLEQNQYIDLNDTYHSTYQVSNLYVQDEELATIIDTHDEMDDAASKPWSQTDEIALVQLVNKYCGGYPNRWSKIAQILGRMVSDVTAKAAEIASGPTIRSNFNEEMLWENNDEDDDYYLSKRKAKRAEKTASMPTPKTFEDDVPDNADEQDDEEEEIYVSRKKQKTSAKAKPAVVTSQTEGSGWTQKEQNQLETAINSFPKGTAQRWQLIAECVPSKTQAEVVHRVKILAEHTKKKKISAD